MDEAFMPFSEVIAKLMAFRGEIASDAAGVRSYIYACELELPVELSIVRDEQGALQVGSTPPLYYVDTSVRPSFHHVAFTAEVPDVPESIDGD